MSGCQSIMLEPASFQINQMPAANFEWDRDLEEWDWSTVSNGLDLEVPPEEFWKKFEELPDLGDNLETLFAEVSGIGSSSPGLSPGSDLLRNHDCMWAGTCHSKDHPPKETASPQPASPQRPPVVRERKRTVIVQKSRSLLLNNRHSSTELPTIRPDTPQSLSESEDEPPAVAARVTEVTGQVRRQTLADLPEVTAAHIDHNYDTKKLRTDDLGVQTPSDSEEEVEEEVEEEEEVEDEEEEVEDEEEDDEDEEIDVVSLSNTRMPTISTSSVRTIRTVTKTPNGLIANHAQRSSHALPTNPSKQMRTQIQDEMASAITTNSLISASKAVSRRLNGAMKRKRGPAPAAPARGRRRSSPAKRSRFSTGQLIDTEKRSLHNNMERMRRVDLRNAFEDLRLLVPTISDSHKAAKVTILKDATHYVRELHLKDRNMSAQLVALRRDQERLRTTLSQLRRIFAYKNSQQNL